jgi:two-component system invasion response regulator UvrY
MKRLRTLLVDDNKSFLVLSKHLLAPIEGLDLVGFGHDGFDAVRLADELRPDLIIMDLVMPGMSGLQATRLIKAQDHPPRIIIVSHYDDAEHREHASQAGADGFVEKNNYEVQIKELVRQLQLTEAER